MTALVGRLVAPAMPSSAREETKMYGMPWSSQRTGICEMTSMGEMSPARTTIPLEDEATLAAGMGDFRTALTTSLTPRFNDLLTAAAKKEEQKQDVNPKARPTHVYSMDK